MTPITGRVEVEEWVGRSGVEELVGGRVGVEWRSGWSGGTMQPKVHYTTLFFFCSRAAVEKKSAPETTHPPRSLSPLEVSVAGWTQASCQKAADDIMHSMPNELKALIRSDAWKGGKLTNVEEWQTPRKKTIENNYIWLQPLLKNHGEKLPSASSFHCIADILIELDSKFDGTLFQCGLSDEMLRAKALCEAHKFKRLCSKIKMLARNGDTSTTACMTELKSMWNERKSDRGSSASSGTPLKRKKPAEKDSASMEQGSLDDAEESEDMEEGEVGSVEEPELEEPDANDRIENEFARDMERGGDDGELGAESGSTFGETLALLGIQQEEAEDEDIGLLDADNGGDMGAYEGSSASELLMSIRSEEGRVHGRCIAPASHSAAVEVPTFLSEVLVAMQSMASAALPVDRSGPLARAMRKAAKPNKKHTGVAKKKGKASFRRCARRGVDAVAATGDDPETDGEFDANGAALHEEAPASEEPAQPEGRRRFKVVRFS
jgi:hypothetical protein